MAAYDYDKYLRTDHIPTQWCPGCGNGIVLKAITRAIVDCGWDMKDVVVVSGIGCSGRISSYLDCHTVHTTHGGAIPTATGILFANPDKHVIVVSGDGDGLAIGASHFVHACRRNIGLNYVVINNFIYGLTNSQASPTTPQGMWAVTQQAGVIERPFDACDLAIGAHGTFVARSTTLDLVSLSNIMTKAFKHPGFSFVEVFSACPVNFGRNNGMGDPEKNENWIDSIVLPKVKFDALDEASKAGMFPTGILLQNDTVPEFCASYDALVASLQEGGGA